MRVREKNHSSFLSSRSVLIILISLFFIFSFYTYKTFYKKYQIKKEISILDDQINKLQNKKEKLENEKSMLSEDSYIEREARLKLNFKKKGEKVVVFVNKPYVSEDSKEDIKQEKVESSKKKISGKENFKKWIEVIFGN